MRVPTNAELEANAPDTVREAVKGWLIRHVNPPYNLQTTREKWFDWATDNLLADPEIRGAYRKEFSNE